MKKELLRSMNKLGGLYQGRGSFMKVRKKASSILLAGLLLAGIPVGSYAKQEKPAKKIEVQYVALGDSLAAGQTPYGYMDNGYADYLSNNFKGSKYILNDFDNFGVPGYTSVQLKNDVLLSNKIRKEIKEASHVTIDIGANDLLAKLKDDPTKVSEAIVSVGTNLQTILSTIDKLNPKVKVYVMGYYNPFVYYPKEQQAVLLPLLNKFNGQIELVTKTNGDTYVSTDAVIAANYKINIPNPKDIHLSAAGYETIAKVFWNEIDKK